MKNGSHTEVYEETKIAACIHCARAYQHNDSRSDQNPSADRDVEQLKIFKPTNMITVLMFLLGFFCFWLLFRLVDVLDKI